jgi:hypothetical protein
LAAEKVSARSADLGTVRFLWLRIERALGPKPAEVPEDSRGRSQSFAENGDIED